MQTFIDPLVDRSVWPSGEWDGEPDKAQWKDEATGLVCLAKRVSWSGHWCGYVGVTEGHPWFGKSYSDLPDYGPTVHGGLTFSDFCHDNPEMAMESRICHVPAPGESDHVFWFGFDCAHHMDASPRDHMHARDRAEFRPVYGSYRTLDFVRGECATLAAQIKQAGSLPKPAPAAE